MSLADFDMSKGRGASEAEDDKEEFQYDARLDSIDSLDKLNVSNEILIQYQRAERLAQMAMVDDSPLNQKAQALNTVSNILQQLTRMQTELHSSERIKTIEQILIAQLKHLPKETQEHFLFEYEKAFPSV